MDETKKEWFAHALQLIHHPVCLVDTNNRFVWVNAAYERLVGFSEAELLGNTWMSVTEMTDVGGDLAAVQSIIDGEKQAYTTAKKYKSKSGVIVPVALTVWRFPQSGQLLGFSVEAMPEDNMKRIEAIHAAHILEIRQLEQRIREIEAIHSFVRISGEALLKWLPLVGAIVAALAWCYATFVAV